ncbi:hypothetical protein ACMD2_05433 [Ananas comosus]|uniref:Uncharacterized protein n=1 Tax=Ananas comosus TaxID=4615 RepID=A0A199W427_ANACO|nr:hypothetical protein ACMD2_05433 [Ananas comosus]
MVRSVFFILAFAIALHSKRTSRRPSQGRDVFFASGSPGPDCCKRRCVNVMTDGLNCGRCGAKQVRCSYVRSRQLWRLQEEVQERHLLQIRDV